MASVRSSAEMERAIDDSQVRHSSRRVRSFSLKNVFGKKVIFYFKQTGLKYYLENSDSTSLSSSRTFEDSISGDGRRNSQIQLTTPRPDDDDFANLPTYMSLQRIFQAHCVQVSVFEATPIEDAEIYILLSIPAIVGPLRFIEGLSRAIVKNSESCKQILLPLLERYLKNFIGFAPNPANLLDEAIIACPREVVPILQTFRSDYDDNDEQSSSLELESFSSLSLSSSNNALSLIDLKPAKLAEIITMFYMEELNNVSPLLVAEFSAGGRGVTNPLTRIFAFSDRFAEWLAKGIVNAQTKGHRARRVRTVLEMTRIALETDNLELLYITTSVLSIENLQILVKLSKRECDQIITYQNLILPYRSFSKARQILEKGEYLIPYFVLVGRDMTTMNEMKSIDSHERLNLNNIKLISKLVLRVYHRNVNFMRRLYESTSGAPRLSSQAHSLYATCRQELLKIHRNPSENNWNHKLSREIETRLPKSVRRRNFDR